MINKDELQDEMGDNHIASSAKTQEMTFDITDDEKLKK
jgi:hypothetical protein